jgi:dephospho-CoA kinase
MYTVVLTGGIGSGKSAASDYFATLGITVIDADVISRELVQPGSPALMQIVTTFGDDLLQPDGSLARAKLRTRIFQDADARAQLEAILHPAIRCEMLQQHARATGPYVLLVIPLWPTSQATYPADRVLLIDVPVTVQRARIQQRDQISADAASQIIASQCSRADYLAAADDVIRNTGTLAALHQTIDQYHLRYLHYSTPLSTNT